MYIWQPHVISPRGGRRRLPERSFHTEGTLPFEQLRSSHTWKHIEMAFASDQKGSICHTVSEFQLGIVKGRRSASAHGERVGWLLSCESHSCKGSSRAQISARRSHQMGRGDEGELNGAQGFQADSAAPLLLIHSSPSSSHAVRRSPSPGPSSHAHVERLPHSQR